MLPKEFSDLQRFEQKWALPLESQRYRARIESTMTELRDFYETATPHLSEILAYLSQFQLDEMPEEVRRLLQISLSLMEISHAVEMWRQPDLPDAFDPYRLIIALDHPS